MTQTRVTQVALESVDAPTPGSRFTQDIVEAVTGNTGGRSRFSQDVLEVVVSNQTRSRATQVVVEVLVPNAPPVDLSGLSGQLWPRGGDPLPTVGTTPSAHASTHENGGSDEIDVTGLSGTLADTQPTTIAQITDATAAGKSLLDDANAAAQRTTLGLGSVATLDVDTDTAMAANSNTRVPSQAAVVAYVAANSGGGGSGALVLLESHTASASTTLDFTTRNASGQSGATIQSDFDLYVLEIDGLTPATNSVDLLMRLSVNGGASYLATNVYSIVGWVAVPGGSGQGGNNPTGVLATNFNLTVGNAMVNNNTYGGYSGTLRLKHPQHVTKYPHIRGDGHWVRASDLAIEICEIGGMFHDLTGVNALQLAMSSGNITSGVARLYGIAK